MYFCTASKSSLLRSLIDSIRSAVRTNQFAARDCRFFHMHDTAVCRAEAGRWQKDLMRVTVKESWREGK